MRHLIWAAPVLIVVLGPTLYLRERASQRRAADQRDAEARQKYCLVRGVVLAEGGTTPAAVPVLFQRAGSTASASAPW